jgi:hypothetical protein
MANLGYTAASRYGCASILIASVNYAIEIGLESNSLIKKLCSLGKSIDLSIRTLMLDNISLLIPKLKMEETKDMLVLEVLNVLKETKIELGSKAIEVIIKHQQFFNNKILKTHFMPEIISSIIKSMNSKLIFNHYNDVLELLLTRNLVTAENASTFQDYFKQLWNTTGETFIQSIASLPSMAHLDFELGAEEFAYETDIVDRVLSLELLSPFSNSLLGV